MASISSKSIVREILESNGKSEDPPIVLVYSYETLDFEDAYAIFTSPDFDDLKAHNSSYCHNVTCLMANGMLTVEGRKWLSENT